MTRRNTVLAGLLMSMLLRVSPAAGQTVPSPIVAPVVFHWGQVQTPWPTLEGGSVAGASVKFWRRQIKLFEAAGINTQLFQVSYDNQTSQRNHLAALRDLARERAAAGEAAPPFVAPFFAAETFPDYFGPKHVASPQGFDAFYAYIRGFFTMYAEYFPDPARPGRPDTSRLAKVDGRVFVTMWWIPLTDYALPGTFFSQLNDRLERDFGFRAYWSVHEWLRAGNPDDINYLFNGPAPLQRGENPAHPAVDLLVAFWPPNLTDYRRDLFAPRNGGQTYGAAWDAVIKGSPRPDIVLIESYNEISEGSHLMASWPVTHAPGDSHWSGDFDFARCDQKPCHPVQYTDAWGSDNAWHYLDLTRKKLREWQSGAPPAGADVVPPHVLILTPKTDEGGGGAIPLLIIAADDVGLSAVNVYLDGSLVLKATASIDRLLKTWALANGRHRLMAEVIDRAGNRDTDVSDFIVSNPPVGPANRIAPAGEGASGVRAGGQGTEPAPAPGTLAASGPWCRTFEPVAPHRPGAAAVGPLFREVMEPCLVR